MALYLNHFGIKESPFKITPTTEFFYTGGLRGELLKTLEFSIMNGEGTMLVIGEVGIGKTMLLRTLMEQLPDNINLVYIPNPSLTGREILYNICEELGIESDLERPDTVRKLQDYLIEKYREGKRTVVFIDEAQAMPDESLEEVRLLTNLETNRDKLVQIVLFGQPELDDKLAQQKLRQLRDRITVRLKLQPLNASEVTGYINSRLRSAGYAGSDLFPDRVCAMIAKASGGLSRRINIICDKALLASFSRGGLAVLPRDVRVAIRDAEFLKMKYVGDRQRRLYRRLIAAAGAGVGVFAVAALLNITSIQPDLTATIIAQEASAPVTVTTTTTVPATPVTVLVTPTVELNTTSVPPATVLIEDEVIMSIDIAALGATVMEEALEQSTITESAAVTTALADEVTESSAREQETIAEIIREVNSGKKISKAEIQRYLEELADELDEENSDVAIVDVKNEGSDKVLWQVETEEHGEKKKKTIADNDKWSWMPRGSYLRQRLNATEAWFENNDGGSYTARLITVSQERSVFLEKFLRHFSEFYPLRNLMIYPMRLRTGDKFVVTFGVYQSEYEASIFLDNLPYAFVGGRPYAQSISESILESSRWWHE